MTVADELGRFVRDRAHGRCEYCTMHQSLQGATFHVEHVVPSSRGGASDADNLALACPSCNLHKADRVEAVDPDTGRTVALFNPRTGTWSAHFAWDGYELRTLTDIGRATAAVLQLNHPRRIRIRQVEEVFGLFPSNG